MTTSDDGEAWTQYQAGEEEDRAEIEAIYKGRSKKIEIVIRPHLLWDMECDIHYYQYHPKYRRLIDGYNDRWKSRVIFLDIPLSQLAEADFTAGYPESAENPEIISLYRKWLGIKKNYESQGSFDDYRFTVYDGAELHNGKANGQPLWIMGIGVQAEKPDYSNKEEKRLRMVIRAKMKTGTVMVSIHEKAGVKTPFSIDFERKIEFPKEKILEGQPFTLDLKEPDGSINYRNIIIRFTPKE